MIRTFALITLLISGGTAGAEGLSIELSSTANAGTQGILLTDLAPKTPGLPKLVLAPAPPVGRPLFLSRFQIGELIAKAAPDMRCTNWSGAEKVRVIRTSRLLDETALKEMLRAELQAEHVKDRGELELRFARPWNTVAVPDDVLTVKIVELPTLGVSPNFVCRFELQAGGETVGVFQQPVQARVWKEIYVARSGLVRGQLLRDADVTRERRDVLALRDFMTEAPVDDPYVELRENVQAGNPLTARSLRLRAIIKRGRTVDAQLQDENLNITIKAEALEDGVPGQMVRVRNARSKREFKGKVLDEQTVTVAF